MNSWSGVLIFVFQVNELCFYCFGSCRYRLSFQILKRDIGIKYNAVQIYTVESRMSDKSDVGQIGV